LFNVDLLFVFNLFVEVFVVRRVMTVTAVGVTTCRRRRR
jgi:hypothetical protein